MKCSETEPSQTTGSCGCVGGANLIGRFRPALPSSLADGAFGMAVLHLFVQALKLRFSCSYSSWSISPYASRSLLSQLPGPFASVQTPAGRYHPLRNAR